MNSNRKIIRNGSIYIEKNKIVEVEKSDNMKNKSAEITIDAKNKLILPGYVNVHTHLPSVFVRGVYGVVAKGLTYVLFPLKTYFTPEDMYLFGLVSCIEALHGGSTTIAENYNYLDSFALAVKETGIRAILGEQIAEADLYKIKDDVYQYNTEQAEAALGRAKKLIKKWQGAENGRITTNVAPLAPDMTTYKTYQKCKEISEKHNLKLTTHLSQSVGEVQQVKKKYGLTPPEFLDKLGLMNENTLCAHCSNITDKDRMNMSKNRVSVLHCPRPYAAGGRTNPLIKLLDMGVKVGLATDNVFHSMNETMRVGLFASRIRSEFIGGSNRMDGGIRPGYLEMLELATIRGAEVLGIEKEVGSIDSGKKADIIMYDLTIPHLQPTMEPVSSIVLYGTSGDVDTVLVDGKIIKNDKKILGINVKSIVEKSQERVEELWAEFFRDNPESKKLWESYLPY
jgi:5-methylthioadenosine/S-adenosylhomocysteine deaminase